MCIRDSYYYGYGVQYKDYGEAVKWYTKAAEQGYADAPVSYTHLDVYKRQIPSKTCKRAYKHQSKENL